MKPAKCDLHGTRHGDVRRVVIRFVEENWNSGREVEIVTGNSQKMKALVIEVLEEYRVDYHSGIFGYNSGSIRMVL